MQEKDAFAFAALSYRRPHLPPAHICPHLVPCHSPPVSSEYPSSTPQVLFEYPCEYPARPPNPPSVSAAATSAPGLSSPLPHLRRDWARAAHVCRGTGQSSRRRLRALRSGCCAADYEPGDAETYRNFRLRILPARPCCRYALSGAVAAALMALPWVRAAVLGLAEA